VPYGLLDVETGKVARVSPGPPQGSLSGYGTSSLAAPGSLARPDGSGAYIIFDGKATWSFDPRKRGWKRLALATSPGVRARANLAYHAGLDVWVLCGGWVGKESSGRLADTWVYAPRLTGWRELKPRPVPQSVAAIWYDEARDLIAAFTLAGETWTLKIAPSF
jgi:hypothetical protein